MTPPPDFSVTLGFSDCLKLDMTGADYPRPAADSADGENKQKRVFGSGREFFFSIFTPGVLP